MSTMAVVPTQTLATPGIKTEVINFAIVVKLDSEGKIVAKSVRHTSSEKDINTLKGIGEKGESVPYTGDESIAFEQAVIKPSVGTEAGFAELITDPEERLNIINKGIASKFNQKIRTTLIELDNDGNLAFQPVEPSFDATSLVQEAALRTNMSPTDKALKTLAGLPPDVLAAVLAQFKAAASGASQE